MLETVCGAVMRLYRSQITPFYAFLILFLIITIIIAVVVISIIIIAVQCTSSEVVGAMTYGQLPQRLIKSIDPSVLFIGLWI